MRRFSANYVFTNNGKPIQNGVVGVNSEGQVIELIDHRDGVREYGHTEFRNGVIVPGFVNAHCHTELSHLKGKVKKHTGLANFVGQMKDFRLSGIEADEHSIVSSLKEMERLGTNAVGDICNTDDSFGAKLNSKLRFINFIELLGLDPDAATNLLARGKQFAEISARQGIPAHITPHSVYSLSLRLWEELAANLTDDSLLSIHYAESLDEAAFVSHRTGGIHRNYTGWGLPFDNAPNDSPLNILKAHVPAKAKLLLIHNTYLSQTELVGIQNHFTNCTFVLCPSSNLYIEQRLPDIPMISQSGARIALGTDSLASSETLSVFDQLKHILQHYPQLAFEQVLAWATLGGAQALGMDQDLGSIEPGKAPGLNLISPFNFDEMKPFPHSKILRLV